MHILHVALTGDGAPWLWHHIASGGAVDGLAVFTKPLAHAFQAFESCGREFAIRLRANVEQQVCALARSVDEQLHNLRHRLIVLVHHLVAPHAVHRLAGLQRQTAYRSRLFHKSGGVFARQVALKNLNVLAVLNRLVVVVANQARRLQAVNHIVLRTKLPVKRNGVAIVVPKTVEPNGSNLAVASEQFGELLVHKVVIVRPVGVFGFLASAQTGSTGWIVLARPVDMRIVEVQTHVGIVARGSQFAHHIAVEWRSIYDVIIRRISFPHREAIVMACGETNVLRSSVFKRLHPLFRIEAVRVERIGGFRIFVAVGA